MARPLPLREKDYSFRSFTLEDYLKDDSPFKLGLEFEKSDEEIREYLLKQKAAFHKATFHNSPPFEGKFGLKINNREVYCDSEYSSYPLTDVLWLVRNIQDYSKEITEQEKNLIASLLREKREPSDERKMKLFYDHIHNSIRYEKKPIIYYLDSGDLVVESLADGLIFSEKTDFDFFTNELINQSTNILKKLKQNLSDITGTETCYIEIEKAIQDYKDNHE